MKIKYFLKNGIATAEDKENMSSMRKQGNKITFSNGNIKKGFECDCDAVYLSHDFPHVEKWAVSKGIEVMKPVAPVVEPKSEPETNDADALSDGQKEEAKAEEEVKPRRTRRTKAAE